MIGKAKAIAHYNAISYGLNKPLAQEICRGEGLGGENAAEIEAEMKLLSNPNYKNNLIRIELCPSPKYSQALSKEDWAILTREFLQKMGLHDNRQWIAVLHKDTAPKYHLHIYANRLDFNTNPYKDAFIMKKANHAAAEMALERGWETALSVKRGKQKANEPIQELIHKVHREVSISGLSAKLYQQMMKKRGVEVIFNQSRTTGHISGMSFKIGDLKIKASDVGLSYNKVFGVDQKRNKTYTPSSLELLRGIKKPPYPICRKLVSEVQ